MIPSEVSEKLSAKEDPISAVQRLASEKARAVFDLHNTVTIGSDTIVVFEGRILGKPKDADDALRMLEALRGRTHTVITGVAVIDARGKLTTNTVQTDVEFRDYDAYEMDRYVATGDPMDKAGAYAIQHPQFRPARRITGCCFNVVGLPLCTVSGMLSNAGVTLKIRRPAAIPGFCLSSEVCPIGKPA